MGRQTQRGAAPLSLGVRGHKGPRCRVFAIRNPVRTIRPTQTTVRITIHRVFLLFMVDLLFILDFSERAVFPVGGVWFFPFKWEVGSKRPYRIPPLPCLFA
jgi:hypothetical protein